jgi:predicted aminopeptidase
VRKWLLLAAAALLVVGCQSLGYYSQAIGGHLKVMAKARPLDDVLADPATNPELRQRLQTARRIRDFATRELGLPENGSYQFYAELDRPYVVWNVFAAPELSVTPKSECFPITGCVSYRGFYREDEAQRAAQKLREAGYDVYMGGVPAYSTLGWFDDPLLSTFIRYPDAQLARLVFHELAHQVAYAKNDTAFNESFAVTVEEEGVKRWLAAEGRSAELAAFHAGQERKREFASRVAAARARLDAVYHGSFSREEKLERKRAEFDALRAAYPAVIPPEANNAFLASIALYTELVPGFEKLLAESGSLPKFYERVKDLAGARQSERDAVFRKEGYRRSS